MRVYFPNLGCKLNQAEVDHAARRFVAAGHSLAPRLDEADLHVVNSCTVTHLAARDSRKLARRGRRLQPSIASRSASTRAWTGRVSPRLRARPTRTDSVSARPPPINSAREIR